jgi:hypothetical protein
MKPILNWLRRNYLLVLFIVLLPVARNRVEPNLRGVIWSDAEGYFVYLPAVFCLGDVHAVPPGSMNARTNEKGETVMKYTCGVAYFQLPFFLVAKVYSDTHGYPGTDIYNTNYSRAIAFAGYCAAFLGLFFLQKALRRRGMSPPATALTLLIIFGGTNLFHYATKEMGMSHVYSFCLFAVLMWLLPRFYERPNWKNAILLGIITGWITLIRPTNIVGLLVVLLYDIYSLNDLKGRVKFWTKHYTAAIFALLSAFLVFFPQLLYWKTMTGQWVKYSYEGEGFPFWDKPKIAAVLVDPQNGLFLYSPLVLLSLAGIVTTWREKRFHGPVLSVIFIVSTYIFASWWAWWFGGAFGARSYVELYALLAFPTAGIVAQLLGVKNRILKFAGIGIILFFIYYGVQMSFLYQKLPGPWDGADWRWNMEKMYWIWKHLFKW